MYEVTIRCPGAPTPDTLGPALEALTEANTLWYLEQWRAGRRPATTCAGGGVVYRPHSMGTRSTWRGAREMLDAPRRGWSCQECAALEAGAARAAAVWGGMRPEQARLAFRCALDENGRNDFHAVVASPDGYLDPTEELRR